MPNIDGIMFASSCGDGILEVVGKWSDIDSVMRLLDNKANSSTRLGVLGIQWSAYWFSISILMTIGVEERLIFSIHGVLLEEGAVGISVG